MAGNDCTECEAMAQFLSEIANQQLDECREELCCGFTQSQMQDHLAGCCHCAEVLATEEQLRGRLRRTSFAQVAPAQLRIRVEQRLTMVRATITRS